MKTITKRFTNKQDAIAFLQLHQENPFIEVTLIEDNISIQQEEKSKNERKKEFLNLIDNIGESFEKSGITEKEMKKIITEEVKKDKLAQDKFKRLTTDIRADKKRERNSELVIAIEKIQEEAEKNGLTQEILNEIINGK